MWQERPMVPRKLMLGDADADADAGAAGRPGS